MVNKDSTLGTVLVATILCILCSVVVSTAAVKLRKIQNINKELDMKKNILQAAGVYQKGSDIDELFKNFVPKVINLETGEEVTGIDVNKYDQLKAAKDPKQNLKIPANEDVGGLKQRAKFAKIFLMMDGSSIKQIVLPVHGKGLWSTMYGYIVLSPNANNIEGFSFYKQGETAGLGGEVDNPKWKEMWKNKKIYNENFSKVLFKVAKGQAINKNYEIDGLSGATITSNGVTSMMKYWFGNHGFGKYLAKFRNQLTEGTL